jgi:hypothetical protein
VVWEPITIKDVGAPDTETLKLMNDSRVRQFWDRHHLLAKEFARRAQAAKSDASYPRANCCVEWGYDLDEAQVYPAGPRWRSDSAPKYWDGAVFFEIARLENALRRIF